MLTDWIQFRLVDRVSEMLQFKFDLNILQPLFLVLFIVVDTLLAFTDFVSSFIYILY